ncbi:MAG TPA: exosortase/archaeosortase family protein [Anaerohalosphaeraceae bacterium]|nr:exosortase/archaeosortase family protein [Anaerohalosphaeraceae bacterium]
MAPSSAATDYSASSPSMPSSGWRRVSIATYIQIAIVGILFYSFFYKDIHRLVVQWLDPSWSHGFLIPLFSLYLLNRRKEDVLQAPIRPSYFWGILGLTASLGLYALNIAVLKFGYGYPLLMLTSLASAVLLLGGWKLFQQVWLPIFYLYFAIPLPADIYTRISRPLRLAAAHVSTAILDLIPNLEAVSQGVTIEIEYKGVRLEPALDVAEACSGMRLLWAFLALSVLMAYLHKRPAWQKIILLVSTIPIAILCNMIRVTVTGLIYIFGDPQYAQGIYHDLLGMMMIFVAFFFYWGLAWLMENLFVEETETPASVIIRRRSSESSAEKEERL